MYPEHFFLRQNHRLGGTFYKLEKTKSGWLIKVICVYFWPEIVFLFSFLEVLNSIKGMGVRKHIVVKYVFNRTLGGGS